MEAALLSSWGPEEYKEQVVLDYINFLFAFLKTRMSEKYERQSLFAF